MAEDSQPVIPPLVEVNDIASEATGSDSGDGTGAVAAAAAAIPSRRPRRFQSALRRRSATFASSTPAIPSPLSVGERQRVRLSVTMPQMNATSPMATDSPEHGGVSAAVAMRTRSAPLLLSVLQRSQFKTAASGQLSTADVPPALDAPPSPTGGRSAATTPEGSAGGRRCSSDNSSNVAGGEDSSSSGVSLRAGSPCGTVSSMRNQGGLSGDRSRTVGRSYSLSSSLLTRDFSVSGSFDTTEEGRGGEQTGLSVAIGSDGHWPSRDFGRHVEEEVQGQDAAAEQAACLAVPMVGAPPALHVQLAHDADRSPGPAGATRSRSAPGPVAALQRPEHQAQEQAGEQGSKPPTRRRARAPHELFARRMLGLRVVDGAGILGTAGSGIATPARQGGDNDLVANIHPLLLTVDNVKRHTKLYAHLDAQKRRSRYLRTTLTHATQLPRQEGPGSTAEAKAGPADRPSAVDARAAVPASRAAGALAAPDTGGEGGKDARHACDLRFMVRSQTTRLLGWIEAVAEAVAGERSWETGEPVHDYHSPAQFQTTMTEQVSGDSGDGDGGPWLGPLTECNAAQQQRELQRSEAEAAAAEEGAEGDEGDLPSGLRK